VSAFDVPTRQTIYTEADRAHFSIRRYDWQRLHRDLTACDVSGTNFYANAAWAAFGLAGGGLLAVVGFNASEQPAPQWAQTIAWVLLAGGVVIFVLCLFMARDKAASSKKLVTQIAADMQQIEASFATSEQAVAVTTGLTVVATGTAAGTSTAAATSASPAAATATTTASKGTTP